MILQLVASLSHPLPSHHALTLSLRLQGKVENHPDVYTILGEILTTNLIFTGKQF